MSSHPDFVHLHVHSDGSLLDGANPVDRLVRRAKDFEMPALALTDHGVMYAAWEFHEKASKEGIKPLVGMEAYVAPGSRLDKKEKTVDGKNAYHLVLLAQNRTGYENLVKLSSIGWKEGFYYNPRLDHEVLARHSEGLIVTSACLAGEVAQGLRAGNEEMVRKTLEFYANAFPDRYYLEVQAHDTEGQEELNRRIFELSEEYGLPVVGTNDAHFLTGEDHDAHDVMICVGLGKDRDDPGRLRYDEGLYFKNAREMAERFPDRPDVLENTVRIAESVDLTFQQKYHVPAFPLPEERREQIKDRVDARKDEDPILREFLTREDLSEAEREQQAIEIQLIRDLTYEGATARYGDPLPPEIQERIDYELGVIAGQGYAGYHLIVQDFINWSREQGSLVGPGRGSAAGSIVCYCLGITDIDPIAHDLLFERFLNPDRVSMPDIDIDFEPDHRSRVIEYTQERYGDDAVGQIITFGTMQARAAVRDVGRVLGWPVGEVDKLAKMIPNEPNNHLSVAESTEKVDEVRRFYESDERYRELLDYASKLEGLRRHASIHAAGLVIAPGPIDDYVPVCTPTGKNADSDMLVSQYDMNCLERAGMLKMDFLGLKTLTVIRQCKEMAEERHGVSINLDELDPNDPDTYRMIQEGRTAGIFQLESALATEKLKAMKADRFEDLVATNALIRPGPLDTGMAEAYIRRKHGEEAIDYPHPDLEEVLGDTYGIIVYQEQVMRVAQLLAGYSLGEADILRKAVGKKDTELIRSELDKFTERCVGHGVERAKAEEIAALIETFGRYGFNRSHSAAYSVISFQTAYLKERYPHEFMAALLTSEIQDKDKKIEYLNEARKMDVPVLPPDVRESEYGFTVTDTEEGPAVRFGLGAVSGIGEKPVAQIIAARGQGAFTDYLDFVFRAHREGVPKKAIEILIDAGALDELGANRAQMHATLDVAVKEAERVRDEQAKGQMNLLDQLEEAGEGVPSIEIPELEELPNDERLAREKEAVGVYVSGHPLGAYAPAAESLGSHQVADLKEVQEGQEIYDVRMVGVLSTIDEKIAKSSGRQWARAEFEDLTGQSPVLIFPDAWERHRDDLEEGQLVALTGTCREDALILDQAFKLEELIKAGRIALSIDLPLEATRKPETTPAIKAALEKHPGPSPVVVHFLDENGESVGEGRSASLTVDPTEDLLEKLGEVVGSEYVRFARSKDVVPKKTRKPDAARSQKRADRARSLSGGPAR